MTIPRHHLSAAAGILLICQQFIAPHAAAAPAPVDYISPIIGTGVFGKTFPGAATPAGMVQLSPDTITGGDNGSGYRNYHKTIQGFSFTHMSGVGWYGDLGNFMVMPTTGPLKTWYGETDKPGSGYLSSYVKDTEDASAGYYAVTLADYKIRAEMTAAPHSGILRFTFPQNAQSRIQIDLARRVGGTSLRQTVKVVADNAIEGEIECAPAGGGWGHGGGRSNYTVYYHAEFSKPLKKFGVWSATLPSGPYQEITEKPAYGEACQKAEILPGCRGKEGRHLGFYTEFSTTENEVVLMKAGISYVSIAGARANLAAEIPGQDFDQVHKQARAAWAAAMGRASVQGGTEAQKTAFYTALYHAQIDPRIFADINGDYPGGDGKTHATKTFTKRTMFSGWDVYRSAYPLLTIIAPEIVNDEINSQVELAEQNNTHVYDRWEILNAYSGCMNGNPTVAVISDAYQKGIRRFDVGKAYEYCVNSCERIGCGPAGFDPSSVSDTMEYAMHNWDLGQFAKALGKTDDAAKYFGRSAGYKQLFDPEAPWTYDKTGKEARPEWKGWFHTKNKAGQWDAWEGLTSHTGVIEASIYQQGWFVPHDLPGLISLLGGKDAFVAKLSDFFDRTPDLSKMNSDSGANEVRTDYYNHPNEPCHLMAFLFNRAGAPWLTQKWVRKIDGLYTPGANGLCGDEDMGQMSAWFVLAASGLHQACPGDMRFEIFTPLFDKVAFKLDPKYTKGGTFTITAKNNSPENIFIQSAALNGHSLNRCWLDFKEITTGGTLDLVLGPEPNKNWGLDIK